MQHTTPSGTSQDGFPATPRVGWQAPLVDMALMLVRRRVLFVTVCLLCLVVAYAKYQTTDTAYRASAVAVLLPREKPLFDVAVDAGAVETAEDGAKREATGALMLPADPALYVTLFRSHDLLVELATRFEGRLDLGFEGDLEENRAATLRRMIDIETTEQGMITVAVTGGDPRLCADLANAVIAQGEQASKAIERSLIEQQAGHIRGTLAAARLTLGERERQLKSFAARYDVVDPRVQANDRVREKRDLAQRLAQIERDLAARRLSYTEEDTGVAELRAQADSCKKQIASIEADWLGGTATREMGELLLSYEALAEEVRLQRDLVATLTAREEVFRIRTEQPAGSLAVVRPATARFQPVGPSRKSFAMIGGGLGLVLGFTACLIREQWDLGQSDPYVRRKTQTLWRSLRLAMPQRFVRRSWSRA